MELAPFIAPLAGCHLSCEMRKTIKHAYHHMLCWIALRTAHPLSKEPESVNVLNVILLVLLFISGLLTVALVLMHSGKGTGVSDMIASSLYNASAGSGIWEKNLDRLTVITSVIFVVCVIVMAVTFPTGTIGLAG